MTQKLAFLVLGCLSLASCAHVDTLHEKELDKIGATDSGVIFSVHLSSEDAMVVDGGCKLTLRQPGGVTDYALDIQAGNQVIFAKLPAGDYRVHDIECFERTWDLTEKGWPNLTSTPGKIAVTPPFEFHYAGRMMMGSGFKGREASQAQVLAVMGRLPASVQQRVVSAYEPNPVTLEMVQHRAHWGHFQIADLKSGKALDAKTSKSAGFPNFKSCYRGEALVNSLWLGDLEVEADFQAAHFEKLEVKPAQHTFSQPFVDCVKVQIQSYKPSLQAGLKYSFFL